MKQKEDQKINTYALRESLNDDGAKNFGNAILKSIEELGLGVLSKSDFEALMFHHIVLNIEKTRVKDQYDWMRILKLTPSKLKSLQQIRIAKHLTLDLNNENKQYVIETLKNASIDIENPELGLIRFYIPDVHAQMLIEKIVVGHKSMIDFKLNSNILVIKFDSLLKLMDLFLETDEGDIVLGLLKKDRSAKKYASKIKTVGKMWDDFTDDVKENGKSEILKQLVACGFEIVKNKITGK